MGGFDMGFGLGARMAEQRQQQKQWLSEEQVEAQKNDLNNRIAGVQAEMGKDPSNADLKGQMQQLLADRTKLFNPNNGPHAMAALGKLVHQHFHGKQPQAQAQNVTPAVSLPQQGGAINAPAVAGTPESGSTPAEPGVAAVNLPGMAGAPVNLPAQAGPVVHQKPPTPADLKQIANQRYAQDMGFGIADPQKDAARAEATAARTAQFGREQTGQDRDWQLQWAQKHSVPPEAVQELTEHLAGVPTPKVAKPMVGAKPYKGADGKYYISVQDPTDSSIRAEAMPPDYVPPPPTEHQSNSRLESFVRSQFPKGASANQRVWAMKFLAQLDHPATRSSHESIQYNTETGEPSIVDLTNTSRKDYGAAGPPPPDEAAPGAAPAAATTPATPRTLRAQAKAAITPPAAAGSAKPDPRLAGLHHNTSTQNKGDEDVRSATKLVSMADQALSAHSAALDKVFLGSMQRLIEGRFNQGAYDNLSKKYGLVNTFEGWMNSLTNGAFPDEVRAELVQAAHANLTAAQAGQTQAQHPNGGGGDWKPPAGAPDASKYAEGFTLHKKGSDDVVAVQRGGQWTKP